MKPLIAHRRPALRRRFFSFTLGATAALAGWTIPQIASAQRLGPSGLDEVATGSWTKLTNQPPFNTDSANLPNGWHGFWCTNTTATSGGS
jgi:hypothetical protein